MSNNEKSLEDQIREVKAELKTVESSSLFHLGATKEQLERKLKELQKKAEQETGAPIIIWKEPETVLCEDELKQKGIPYFCDDGYMYYYCALAIIRARRDGTEAIMLYYKNWESNYSLKISKIEDGYLYFNISGEYTYQASDPMYEAVRKDYDYRVKTDETRELQLIYDSEDYKGFGCDDFENGDSNTYNPPRNVYNPATD